MTSEVSKTTVSVRTGISAGTKDAIMHSALDLFSRKGFEAVSMQDIAEAVGIRKSSIYSHYKSKDEILQAILSYFIAELSKTGRKSTDDDLLIEEVLQSQGPQGLMSHVWDRFNESMSTATMQKIWRMIAIEMCRNTMIRSFIQRQLIDGPARFWEKAFRAMIRRGQIKGMDPAVLASEYHSYHIYLFLKYLLLGCDDDFEKLKASAEIEARVHSAFFLGMIRS